MARPTKYKAEYVVVTEAYILERLEDKLLPTVEGLAILLSVGKNTLYDWGRKHTKFSNALERLKLFQADALINRGLNMTYSAPMAKMMLSANHGMHERSDKHLSGGLTFAEALHKEMTDSDSDS